MTKRAGEPRAFATGSAIEQRDIAMCGGLDLLEATFGRTRIQTAKSRRISSTDRDLEGGRVRQPVKFSGTAPV